ncbi:MAG: acetyltransferase [Alphaproteobacteria bacterium]|nr:acetyltransferase [Alphaproteobacteria bacterium]
MTEARKLVIVGDSAFAEVAHEYFTRDSNYSVVAFAVEEEYLARDRLQGLPVVSLDRLGESFSSTTHDVYVAVAYAQLNRLRTRLAKKAKEMGYRLASYVSSRAMVSPSATVGEHCFIFEGNVVQPFVRIETNVVLWSGNHIGHHSVIRANSFIASHVVVSGFCDVGENVFLGVNAGVANNIRIAPDCWIGPGVVVVDDTQRGEIYRAPKVVASKVSALRMFKVEP